MKFALLLLAASQAQAGEVVSERVKDYAVTVYRAPLRDEGGMDLDDLDGFALITETRQVNLPAGLSRLRFAGVAGGIQPASALVTGLPDGVIEKNRDAALLSPSALIEATVGRTVILKRENRRSGLVQEKTGTLVSGADGVLFKSAEGTEALRCSGLAESFEFDRPKNLAARPTLSVLVKTEAPISAEVTLSYLAVGFDWAATYTATLSADERELNLGAWVTLANGNDALFREAQTQVVAGRVNRESGNVEPIALGEPIVAHCWPQGTTSDIPEEPPYQMRVRSFAAKATGLMNAAAPPPAMALQEVSVTAARRVQEEQLGDLKLYRVPDRTTVASRQSKQVRLLDRARIPVHVVYVYDMATSLADGWVPAARVIRTRNSAANHLGLPLPSGSVAVFTAHGETALLTDQSSIRDVAVDEEVELKLGASDQVQVELTGEDEAIDSARAAQIPLVPGVSIRSVRHTALFHGTVANALPHAVDFEMKLPPPVEGMRIVRCDHKVTRKDGKPQVALSIPANGEVTVRFVAAGIVDEAVPSR